MDFLTVSLWLRTIMTAVAALYFLDTFLTINTIIGKSRAFLCLALMSALMASHRIVLMMNPMGLQPITSAILNTATALLLLLAARELNAIWKESLTG